VRGCPVSPRCFIGSRGAARRDTVFGFVNVLLPLSEGFVRIDPIPLIGVEATL
jgi:hypothetical protein